MLKRDSKGRFLAKYRYIYLIKYEVKFSNGKVRYDREYDKTVKKIMTTKNAKPIFVLPKFGKIKTKNNLTIKFRIVITQAILVKDRWKGRI